MCSIGRARETVADRGRAERMVHGFTIRAVAVPGRSRTDWLFTPVYVSAIFPRVVECVSGFRPRKC